MLQFIKTMFSKVIKQDTNQILMRKYFKHSYKNFDDTEQAVLMLRLSGISAERTAELLDLPLQKLETVEQNIIARLKK